MALSVVRVGMQAISCTSSERATREGVVLQPHLHDHLDHGREREREREVLQPHLHDHLDHGRERGREESRKIRGYVWSNRVVRKSGPELET